MTSPFSFQNYTAPHGQHLILQRSQTLRCQGFLSAKAVLAYRKQFRYGLSGILFNFRIGVNKISAQPFRQTTPQRTLPAAGHTNQHYIFHYFHQLCTNKNFRYCQRWRRILFRNYNNVAIVSVTPAINPASSLRSSQISSAATAWAMNSPFTAGFPCCRASFINLVSAGL